jgi:hypothetical protein
MRPYMPKRREKRSNYILDFKYKPKDEHEGNFCRICLIKITAATPWQSIYTILVITIRPTINSTYR